MFFNYEPQYHDFAAKYLSIWHFPPFQLSNKQGFTLHCSLYGHLKSAALASRRERPAASQSREYGGGQGPASSRCSPGESPHRTLLSSRLGGISCSTTARRAVSRHFGLVGLGCGKLTAAVDSLAASWIRYRTHQKQQWLE